MNTRNRSSASGRRFLLSSRLLVRPATADALVNEAIIEVSAIESKTVRSTIWHEASHRALALTSFAPVVLFPNGCQRECQAESRWVVSCTGDVSARMNSFGVRLPRPEGGRRSL